jgi:hypothetical protein
MSDERLHWSEQPYGFTLDELESALPVLPYGIARAVQS